MEIKQTLNIISEENEGGTTVANNKEMLQGFKQEVASELGVPLKEGYNGDITARQAGSVGGEMVKRMIMAQENMMRSQQNK